MKRRNIDNEREFDWGKTSEDYAVYRSGYPESFYEVLAALGIGRRGQRILDLGTGTGVLARAFARRGAIVTGVDLAANQIAAAKTLAAQQGLDVAFDVCAAEAVEFPDASFDVVSAAQSWLYFDASVMVPKVLRLLRPDGRLVLTHLLWLPEKDRIARRSEELVLQFNPDWGGAGYKGTMAPAAAWARDQFDLRTFHVMEEPIEFTREAWRGRFRACRGVGASLPPEEVERFDREHAKLLEAIAPADFTVLHQMTIHVYAKPLPMSVECMLENAYRAFNARDIDTALTTMHADVEWPNGMEGGSVHGHDGVRAYWTRQWGVIDPRVEPLRIHTGDDGRIEVEVHQLVRDPAGRVVKDEMVQHAYRVEGGLIRSMEIRRPPASRP
jgi:ubiquinone/menaquinone biosynthesis C-methylase UbiE